MVSDRGAGRPAEVTPSRKCIGCGRVRPQSDMRRFAAAEDGAVVSDEERRLPSRGAYVCDEACLAEATKRRAWGRAFRRAVTAPGTG